MLLQLLNFKLFTLLKIFNSSWLLALYSRRSQGFEMKL